MNIDLGDLDRRDASGLDVDEMSTDLSALLASAAAPGTEEELSGESRLVAAMAKAVAAPAGVTGTKPRRTTRRTAVRVAIVTASVLAGSSAAAATGHLPDAAQSAVSRAGAHLGLDLPDPHATDDSSAPLVTAAAPGTSSGSDDTAASSSSSTDPAPLTVPTSMTTASTSTDSSAASTTPSTPPADPAPTSAVPAVPGATGSSVHPTDPSQLNGLCHQWAAHQEPNSGNGVNAHLDALHALATNAGVSVEELCAPLLDEHPPATTTAPSTSTAPSTAATPAPTTTVAEDESSDLAPGPATSKPDKPKPDTPKPDKPKPDKPKSSNNTDAAVESAQSTDPTDPP